MASSVDGHSIVLETLRVVEDVLHCNAVETEESGIIPSANLNALSQAGLWGLFGPTQYGGADADDLTAYLVHEVVASGCGSTFFLWYQHQSPVRRIAGSQNELLKQRHLERLCNGTIVCGDVNYLRRSTNNEIHITASKVSSGYVLNGSVPWIAGWGYADMYVVASIADGGEIIYFLVEGIDSDHFNSNALDTIAVGAAGCVSLSISNKFVGEESIVETISVEDWKARDETRRAAPLPALFAIGMRLLDILRERAPLVGSSAQRQVEHLVHEFVKCRTMALEFYTAETSAEPQRYVDNRAWIQEFLGRISSLIIGISGGKGAMRRDSAHRYFREAMFFSVQVQSSTQKSASLFWSERISNAVQENLAR